ncbi:hypothetical protein [Ferruginivarius sediminum]|uniref:Uncharacterized protein n=1 Tax=Ferruginivarius sediminum TaxID=2661937 RepID=A0A369TGE4_9PROT|nr:hypothetical protein [Ferruginivarius sediminum]RDD63902.1 hypothetical protein DRB17_01715 [Ferruginivarius sediminum]
MNGGVMLQGLVLIAVFAAGYVTVLKFNEDRRIRDLAFWLRRTHPQRWEALPWIMQKADRLGAVESFRQDPEFHDAEFDSRYAAAKTTRRRQGVGLVVAGIAIVLAVFGYQVLGWRV